LEVVLNMSLLASLPNQTAWLAATRSNLVSTEIAATDRYR